MSDTLNVINYLKSQGIKIDKEEFEYQFSSHPNYPSLLAISDTLSFFNIPNGAFQLDKSEIDLLPDQFVARLNKDDHNFLSYVEKKGEMFSYKNGSRQASLVNKNELGSLWADVVLLADNDDVQSQNKTSKDYTPYAFIPVVGLFITLLALSAQNVSNVLFYLFPIFGFLLSIATLKDLFNTKIEILNKLCNVGKSVSCDTVVNSTKWSFLEKINFGDLSITFFATQIIALLAMGLMGVSNHFFAVQTGLLALSVPVIFSSIYYQKFVEKKWCTLCLLIIGVLLAEAGFLFAFGKLSLASLSLNGGIFYAFVFSSVFAAWLSLKKLLKEQNRLRDHEIAANRFKRNYSLFKNNLLANPKLKTPESLAVLGNPNASLNISIVSSPLCGHCKATHYMLQSLLEKYGDQLKVTILFNVSPRNEVLKRISHTLISQAQNSKEAYYKAMDDWYEIHHTEKWLEAYEPKNSSDHIERTIEQQHEWCMMNEVNFTPCLFVNGHQYPRVYTATDLPFYIDELLEDTSN